MVDDRYDRLEVRQIGGVCWWQKQQMRQSAVVQQWQQITAKAAVDGSAEAAMDESAKAAKAKTAVDEAAEAAVGGAAQQRQQWVGQQRQQCVRVEC